MANASESPEGGSVVVSGGISLTRSGDCEMRSLKGQEFRKASAVFMTRLQSHGLRVQIRNRVKAEW